MCCDSCWSCTSRAHQKGTSYFLFEVPFAPFTCYLSFSFRIIPDRNTLSQFFIRSFRCGTVADKGDIVCIAKKFFRRWCPLWEPAAVTVNEFRAGGNAEVCCYLFHSTILQILVLLLLSTRHFPTPLLQLFPFERPPSISSVQAVSDRLKLKAWVVPQGEIAFTFCLWLHMQKCVHRQEKLNMQFKPSFSMWGYTYCHC